MAQLDTDLLAKLTEKLSGDVDTYNQLINHVQNDNDEITQMTQARAEAEAKLADAEQRGAGYLDQISNLLSRIPIGNNSPTKTQEQAVEEIKNREW